MGDRMTTAATVKKLQAVWTVAAGDGANKLEGDVRGTSGGEGGARGNRGWGGDVERGGVRGRKMAVTSVQLEVEWTTTAAGGRGRL